MRDARCNLAGGDGADFDTAVCLTGYGRFHYEIVALCALCVTTVGFQNGLSSYIFPAAQCELQLTSFELGLLNVSFLAGGVVSSFLWGNLADLGGRRRILASTHLLNALATTLCTLIPLTESLLVSRLLNGFLIGAPGSIIFSYVAEFQPPRYRPASVCLCGLSFTFSWLLLPLLASAVLPLDVDLSLGRFLVLTPWRLFVILLVVPEVLVGAWFLRMPESPRFYAAKGEAGEALKVLRRMYSENTGRSSETFPVRRLVGEGATETRSADDGDVACRSRTVRVLKQMLSQGKELFRPPLLTVTVVFGLGLWFPELFIRFEHYHQLHPNGTITVKELAALNYAKNVTCEPSLDASVIHSTVAMALSAMAYNAVSGWLSTRITVKAISTFSMLAGGLGAASIYFLRTAAQNLAAACVFQATMVTANMAVGSVGVELFPTRVAGMAMGLVICAGRVGAVFSNVIFGYLVDGHCEVPIFVVAAVVLAGAGLCSTVPGKRRGGETIPKKKSLVEDRDVVDVAVIS
ncbi:hypothetical protein NQ318_013901 [Aromia moschata]|uniref:Major facilitator superfamily (MFS) profile domain-containing protein n=1 Tax=Aromia moschata TaxID=1265417 RepID=A0AAV8Z8L2_9CUCU|nr:hypothetical protein NQ318_013901 [Aromia moschata]